MFFSQHLNFEFWSRNFNLRHCIPRLSWKRIFGDILISRITDLKRNTVKFSCLKVHVRIKASGYNWKFPLSLITRNPDCHGGVGLDGKGRKCYRQFPWYEKLYLATFPKENSSLWIFTFNSVALQNLFVVYVVLLLKALTRVLDALAFKTIIVYFTKLNWRFLPYIYLFAIKWAITLVVLMMSIYWWKCFKGSFI